MRNLVTEWRLWGVYSVAAVFARYGNFPESPSAKPSFRKRPVAGIAFRIADGRQPGMKILPLSVREGSRLMIGLPAVRVDFVRSNGAARFGRSAKIALFPEIPLYHLRAVTQEVQVIGPMLHHADSLIPIFAARVGAAHGIIVAMGELAFDSVRMP